METGLDHEKTSIWCYYVIICGTYWEFIGGSNSFPYLFNACPVLGTMLPASFKGQLNSWVVCSWLGCRTEGLGTEGAALEPHGSVGIFPVDGAQAILSDSLILEKEGFRLSTIVEPWHFFLSSIQTLEGRSARKISERIRLLGLSYRVFSTVAPLFSTVLDNACPRWH